LGSLRRGSYHRAVAEALPSLAPEGAAIRYLPRLDLPLYDGDVETAGIPPEVTALGEAIAQSGGLVVVTPEYNHSIPGVLKNAIDWVSRLQPRPLEGKPVALISGSPGARGGVNVQDHLRSVLALLRARVLENSVVIPGIHQKVDPASGIADAATREQIRAHLHALARLAAPEN
jgi:chromate reductase